MRVALVTNTLPPHGLGGAEAYVAALGAALAEAGHDVLVLSGDPGRVEGALVRKLPRLPHLPSTAPIARKLVWHARDQWLPSVFRATLRELRQFAPEVVHTHECQALSASVFSAIERLDIPHVNTAHDLNLLCARVSMTRDGAFCGGRCTSCLIQRTIRRGVIRRHLTRLISVSEYIQRRHLQAGVVPAERAVVVRLGAAVVDARARTLRESGIRLGFIGTLSRHKGVPTLLEALAGAPADWRLAIAGSGPLEGEVAEAARRDARIEFLGQVGGDDKERFFDRIDVLMVPSEWEEPAALVATEAIARGIPTVVSDRGGIPETPEARVFPAGSAHGLAEAVRSLVESPAAYAEASFRLVQRHDEFSWRVHQSKVEEVLRTVVEER